jgi:hypothetical protein
MVSTRGVFQLMLVFWIPVSIIMFYNHSTSLEDNLRSELMNTLRREQDHLANVVQGEGLLANNA